MGEQICCVVPQDWAEPAGSLSQPDVNLFAKLATTDNTTFYDSKCGIPLFVAPIGRSFADFQYESQHHGWPSFRDAELVKDNIVVKPGGEIVSACGTHLGHNLSDLAGTGATKQSGSQHFCRPYGAISAYV